MHQLIAKYAKYNIERTMGRTINEINEEISELTKKQEDWYTRVYLSSLVEPIETSDLYKQRSKGDIQPIIRSWTTKSSSGNAKNLVDGMCRQEYLRKDQKYPGRNRFVANKRVIHLFYRKYALTENEYNLAVNNLDYLTDKLEWTLSLIHI